MRARHDSSIPSWASAAALVRNNDHPPCVRELAALSAFGVDPEDEDEVYNLPHTDLRR